MDFLELDSAAFVFVVLTVIVVEGLRFGFFLGFVASLEFVGVGIFIYIFVGGVDSEGIFALDAVLGRLYLARFLDFEAGSAWRTFIVRVEGSGGAGARLLRV